MTIHASVKDPRSVITPDAFQVAPELLGLPLAPPHKRLGAILVDLLVIGFLAAATKSFGLMFAGVISVFFMRQGFKTTSVRGSVFNRAMRLSVGCLGLTIGLVTAIVGIAIVTTSDDADVAVPGVVTEGADLSEVLRGAGALRAFAAADDEEEAAEAVREIIRRSRAVGLADADIRDLLGEFIPVDEDWSDQAEAIIEDVLAEGRANTEDEDAELRAASDLVADYTPAEALDAYASFLRARDDGQDVDRFLGRALAARLLEDLAGDTLRQLEEQVSDLDRVATSRQRAVNRLTAELEAERSGGLIDWLKDFAEELGVGFGWLALYPTVTLSWWRGQTVGKKLFRIRVLRLDGEPINWWTAFERVGGYAAGFATGLLGFAQVLWDANRQAIHDRIVGTVVVLDGVPKVENWEDAL